MELSKLIVPSTTATIEYPGFPGFEVKLAYLTRDELLKLRKKATNQVFNRSSRKMEEEVDNDIFQTIYIQAILKGWNGLKFKYLKKLLPIDDTKIKDLDECLEFSLDNAEFLMKNCTQFDNWVSAMLEDVENFSRSK